MAAITQIFKSGAAGANLVFPVPTGTTALVAVRKNGGAAAGTLDAANCKVTVTTTLAVGDTVDFDLTVTDPGGIKDVYGVI